MNFCFKGWVWFELEPYVERLRETFGSTQDEPWLNLMKLDAREFLTANPNHTFSREASAILSKLNIWGPSQAVVLCTNFSHMKWCKKLYLLTFKKLNWQMKYIQWKISEFGAKFSMPTSAKNGVISVLYSDFDTTSWQGLHISKLGS